MNTVPRTNSGRTVLDVIQDTVDLTILDAILTGPLTLDAALEAGAEHLERASYFVDRYQLADGTSAYFCRDCGCQTEDIDGCEHCGAGLEDDMED